MNQADAVWVLFLSPVLLLAAVSFCMWIIGRLDRAEEQRTK